MELPWLGIFCTALVIGVCVLMAHFVVIAAEQSKAAERAAVKCIEDGGRPFHLHAYKILCVPEGANK